MYDIEDICNKYYQNVYKYLISLSHNSDLAEELTQETFCIAVKYINSFKGNCKISVWLCQIAKHLWFKEIMKKKKEKSRIDIETLENIENLEEIEDIAFKNSEKSELYKKIEKLDAKTRKVIYLRIKGELSFKEIGNLMKKNENWARVIFYRGKQKLKEVDENERKQRM